MFINLNSNHNLTERDLDSIDTESQLEHQIQEIKESDWRVDMIKLMTINFYKANKMNGSSYVKIPFSYLEFWKWW